MGRCLEAPTRIIEVSRKNTFAGFFLSELPGIFFCSSISSRQCRMQVFRFQSFDWHWRLSYTKVKFNYYSAFIYSVSHSTCVMFATEIKSYLLWKLRYKAKLFTWATMPCPLLFWPEYVSTDWIITIAVLFTAQCLFWNQTSTTLGNNFECLWWAIPTFCDCSFTTSSS